jgi:uncharacterized peroxidase-related enzyme
MRLAKVHKGHGLRDKAMLGLIRLSMGHAAGVVRTLFYRKEFFGRPFSELTQQVMRGPSPWTVGERETFAAFVSRLNQCVFWTNAHSAVAETALCDGSVKLVLENYRTAPIDEKLRAMLGLLETFTLQPERLTANDVRRVLDTGVTREAVRDAFYVAFLFNTYDRLADTLGWELPDEGYYPKAGRFLLKNGYL